MTDDGDLRVVTIDRPARRSTPKPIDPDVLKAVITGADSPVVLLQEDGPAFCVGADFNSVTGLGGPEVFAEHGQRAVDVVESAKSIVVVDIDRATRGGGVELAFACDAQVATPCATLDEPGVRLGLFGARGGMVRLPRAVGGGHALESSPSGHVINTDGALRMGLISRIVNGPGEVMASMAGSGHRSLRIVKGWLRNRGNRDGRLEWETAGFAELHRANVNDVAASREKRVSWTGRLIGRAAATYTSSANGAGGIGRL